MISEELHRFNELMLKKLGEQLPRLAVTKEQIEALHASGAKWTWEGIPEEYLKNK